TGPGFSLNLCIFSLLLWTSTSAFNLDAQNVLRKNGQPGSLFGFSLALHRQLHVRQCRFLGKLLIGAPKARALSNQGANITGGLYLLTAVLLFHCFRCLIVTWFLFMVTLTVDARVENKENQWMGVTVQSQGPGGKIVVRQEHTVVTNN
uniref:Integrin subunit alpha 6 n=1 Tax=Cyprinus carpio TaxID=7962 RepID=A0A8C1YM12_CYPCA